MEFIMSSLKEIYSRFKMEIIMLACALSTVVISGLLLYKSQQKSDGVIKITDTSQSISKRYIHIDIEGAVENPGLYEMEIDSRLKELITKAGGLNKDADEYYFARNFNLAKTLRDQEKIYIPTVSESTNSPSDNNSESDVHEGISINSASRTELDSLDGIGAATVDKLISARPYSSIEELVSKKILKSSVFEKIKDQITL